MPRSSLSAGEERRDLALGDAGITTPSEGKRFTGYAAVFNSRTAIGNPRTWGFFEEIAPGAFTKTIAEGDQRFLWNHNTDYVISRVSAGSLRLSQDERGLPTDSDLDDELSYVRDMKANLRNGNLTGMSFGFTVPVGKDEWRSENMLTDDGQDIEVEVRTIREARLLEVSAVTFPAYEETTAGLRHSLIPALLGRGDTEAIRRAATHRPDLAGLLGYEPELAPTIIDLGATAPAPPAGEPGDPTRRADTSTTPTAAPEPVEPVASTRHAPSQHDLAKARLQELRARLQRSAA